MQYERLKISTRKLQTAQCTIHIMLLLLVVISSIIVLIIIITYYLLTAQLSRRLVEY